MLRRHAITIVTYTNDPDPDTAERLARASVWPREPSRVLTKPIAGARSVPEAERGLRVYGGGRETIGELLSSAHTPSGPDSAPPSPAQPAQR